MPEVCGLAVSRETIDRLESYSDLIRKWNPAINLVAKSTLPDLWQRHIVDSAQLAEFARADDRTWLDLGSGGGLPAIVLAIVFAETRPDLKVTMIESDQRKAVFLRQAISDLGLDCSVITERIENTAPQAADVVSARALAELPQLIQLAHRHMAEGGQCIFLKGRRFAEEIHNARQIWQFQCDEFPSMTNPEAVILRLQEIRRV